jgi:hypothetical protein
VNDVGVDAASEQLLAELLDAAAGVDEHEALLARMEALDDLRGVASVPT